MKNDQRVSLGCGSLILIALIVLLFGNTNDEERILRELEELAGEVRRLEHSVERLSEEITKLQEALAAPAPR